MQNQQRAKAKQLRKTVLSDEKKAAKLGLSKRRYRALIAKENIHRFLNSAPVNIILAFLILFSVVLIFFEFLLPQGEQLAQVIYINDLITWIFVYELSVRFIVAPNKRIYLSNYWIDIISILPAFRVFRTLRALRLLRLLRLTRAAMILLKQSGWLSRRMESQFGNFSVLFFTAVMLVLCGTLAILSLEQPAEATHLTLHTLLDKVLSTMFLFISGEIVGSAPLTLGGKLIACIISLAGLVIFAVMVGTISASMSHYFKTKMDAKDVTIDDLQDHLIICGWDAVGDMILTELQVVPDIWRRGVVIVADTEEDITSNSRIRDSRRLFHVRADFTKIDVLGKLANASSARIAIVLADKGNNLSYQDRDARPVLAALTLEKINPKIYTCAELLSEDNASHLKLAGVEEVIFRKSITAGLIAASAVNEGVTSILTDILTHEEGNYLKKIDVPENLLGKTYIEAMAELKREYDATLIAIESQNERGEYAQHVNPDFQIALKDSDRLTLIVKRASAICELQ